MYQNLPTLYLLIPCYNEEDALPVTAAAVREKMYQLISSGEIASNSKVVLVNDGSKDRTWEIIKELHRENNLFAGLNLSRNRGHQNALLAGLSFAQNYCDISISMDADLQDDINAIDSMISKYKEGYDIVYGVRSSRQTDSSFKRNSAHLYYKLLAAMGVEVVYDHADYRLLSKRTLAALAEFKEVNIYLRGLIPMLGFPSTTVYYERKERVAGKSKYPFKKMLNLALEGITSLSIKPIKIILNLGIIIVIISIIMLIWSLVQYAHSNTIPGWTSTFVSLWFLGGVILLAIGVIGEYVAKTYLESKARPRFIIQDVLLDSKDSLDTKESLDNKESKSKQTTNYGPSMSDKRDVNRAEPENN